MVSQLLVASGVAAACGLLGVSDWLRGRAVRAGAYRQRTEGHRPNLPRQPARENLTPLAAMTGYRQAAGRERAGG